MAIWPERFCPLIGSYQETPPDGTIRSSMDVGVDKLRRRTTANIRPVSFRLFLKPDDVQILDNFYLSETVNGVEPFDFTNPRTKQQVKARFVQPPQYSSRSIGYDVSVSLEILP